MDIMHRAGDIEFEWDARKARINFEKHGVTFEKATEAFFDPFCQGGDASVGGEPRSFILGYTLSRRLLLVVHEERPRTLRIISARAATRAERMLYEQD
jgi:hypothetical protein